MATELGPELLAAISGRSAPVHVALSGGVDSSVLLHLLLDSHRHLGLDRDQIGAVHVNHGLSEEAEVAERHCLDICRQWRAPLEVLRVEVEPPGDEAAARQARYRAWADWMPAGGLLLLGHQSDDVAESVLLNLLRGLGPSGLAGIPERRALGGGAIWRPLLGVSRTEILDCARRLGFAWREDPANRDERFARAHLRGKIAPLLDARFAGWRRTLNRQAGRFRHWSAQLEALHAERLAEHLGPDGQLLLGGIGQLSDDDLEDCARTWIDRTGRAQPRGRTYREIARTLRNPTEGAEVRFGAGALHVWRGAAYLVERAPEPAACDWAPAERPELALPGLCIRAAPGGPLALPERVRIGFRRGGERIESARCGAMRPLKNLLSEAGLAPWDRGRVPLLWDGERLIAAWSGRDWIGAAAAPTPARPGWTVSIEHSPPLTLHRPEAG
ncbi:MAG: tRNA lysidine(34) synthetase TilS [Gammaproteobacteria bacterium AqS3]|nr:tRNA lysidine(34) synthetase TilS [Gammaproteobacteria bacterium AqS3]